MICQRIIFFFYFKNVAVDVRFLDWQINGYASPAIDIIYNIFSSTDKALRDAEYDNLLHLYYDSLANMVELLGSDPKKLFTFNDLNDELKKCGSFAFLIVPMLLQVSFADLNEMNSSNNIGADVDTTAHNNKHEKEVNKLWHFEFENRLNDVFTDLVDLGYSDLI